MRKKTKLQEGIFLLVGAYLIYLGYQLFKGLPETGRNRTIMIIAAVVFIVVGIVVAVRSVLVFIPGFKQDDKDNSAQETETVSEGNDIEGTAKESTDSNIQETEEKSIDNGTSKGL